jgi:poly-gamma-glutamate synthesis protein (capsule biosynthesis protein)
MNRKTLLKIFLPLLFILAVLFGLSQRKQNPYVYDFRSKGVPAAQNGDLSYYYQKAQELAQQNNQKVSASFLVVGDIMLSRNVANVIKKASDPLLPFSKMADVFKEVGFSFGNLESPFSGSDYFNPSGTMVFNAPKGNIKGLVEYKFKILSLANNHALDQGPRGLQYTEKYLSDNNIQHIGTGNNLAEAWQPAVVEQNGIKICFVGASYASVNDNGKTTNDNVARVEDTASLKLNIEKSKSLCDFVVVAMHAGTEYTRSPNANQTNFAHAAVDAGADMVIGGHPHWIQTTEKYNGKYIFYSLGNFIFDQDWSQDTKEGLALKIQISKSKIQNQTTPGAATLDDLQGTRTPAKLDKIELIPVIIENHSTPRPATADEAKRILDKIGLSESILQ